MASPTEVEVQAFDCSLLGDIARITLEYLTLPRTTIREFDEVPLC